VPARIVTLGDSIVQQGGAAAVTSGYSGIGFFPYCNEALSNAYEWRTNAGVGGDTTAMMLARIATVLSENPAWVCVMGGVNDITSDVIATSTTIANLTAIFDAVLAANARLIACVILPTTSFGTAQRKADVDTDNTAIRAYAASHSPVVLCDWWASWSDPNVNGGYSPFAGYTSDGKHPSATGASVMGAYLAGVTNAVKPGTAGV